MGESWSGGMLSDEYFRVNCDIILNCFCVNGNHSRCEKIEILYSEYILITFFQIRPESWSALGQGHKYTAVGFSPTICVVVCSIAHCV